jgi:hypothetical protein
VSPRAAHTAERKTARVEGAVHEAGELLHQQRKLCARRKYIYCVSSHLLLVPIINVGFSRFLLNVAQRPAAKWELFLSQAFVINTCTATRASEAHELRALVQPSAKSGKER